MKGNAEALTESGNASRAAVQDLTKAYQELATKNAKNLTAAMQALAAVKSPAEFMELQQRLIKEGVEAAVSDSQHIAQLTTAVFTAAFEPVKKQIEAVQNDRADLGQRIQVPTRFCEPHAVTGVRFHEGTCRRLARGGGTRKWATSGRGSFKP